MRRPFIKLSTVGLHPPLPGWPSAPHECSYTLFSVTPDMKAQKKIDIKGKNRDELMRMPIRDLKQVYILPLQ